MMLDNKVDKDKEYWEPCPRCESNRVKQVSQASIWAKFWLILIPLAIFLPFIGIPALVLFGIMTLYGIFKNRHMLKCKDCDNQWAYEDNNAT